MPKSPTNAGGKKPPLDLTEKLCVIYARVSTATDQETENQIIQLREFAQRQGWIVRRVIEDKCSGGKAAAEREGLRQVFDLAHRKQFHILLFWSLDRLSREGTRATILYLTQLEQDGIDWHSYTEQYLSSMGIFKDCIVSILSILARQEKIRISERTIAGLQRTRIVNGTRLGRPPTDISRITEATRLRQQGLSFAEIGGLMGVTRSRAHQMVHLSVAG